MRRISTNLSDPTKNTASQLFKIIFIFSAANAIFISIANAFDLNHHLSYVMWLHHMYSYNFYTGLYNEYYVLDLFADYFKLAFSYPGSEHLSITNNLDQYPLFHEYMINAAVRGSGIKQLQIHSFSNLSVPPLSVAYMLLNVKIMKYLSPQLTFFLMLCTIVVLINYIIEKTGQTKKEKLIWFFSFLLSYPFLFIMQRGNLFSAYTALLITLYLIFLNQKKYIGIAILFLALAINFRPNAIIFIFALLSIDDKKNLIQNFLLTIIYTIFIFIISLMFSHWIYPDYTLHNFFLAIHTYSELYIVGPHGDAYNSSLFALLKYIFGYHDYLEKISFLIPAVLFLISILFFYKKWIDFNSYIFIMCCCYMCASIIFGDYHLLIFFAPIILISLTNHNSNTLFYKKIIFYSSCFLLSPKNYIFVHNYISLVELINPIMALIAVTVILYYSFKLKMNLVTHEIS